MVMVVVGEPGSSLMDSRPQLSAVICTHTRERYLRLAINSLLSQRAATEDFEIIVVDNASSDGTAALATSMGSRIHYLHEPRLGLSVARNTGLHAARASIIAYIDDDAIAHPDWASSLIAAFASVGPEVSAIGGKVSPIWEAPRPSWLDDELVVLLSMLDYGELAKPLPRQTHIVGANMAFRTEALRSIGGFPEALGRRGANLLSREEAYVRDRLDDRGDQCVYWPAAAVDHHAAAERLTAGWFRRRLFWQGISRARSNVQERHLGVVGRLARCIYNALRAIGRDARCLPCLPFWSSDRRRRWMIYRTQEWGNAVGYLYR
jgi:glycosyltransferase involved in cell wall biosynthesis